MRKYFLRCSHVWLWNNFRLWETNKASLLVCCTSQSSLSLILNYYCLGMFQNVFPCELVSLSLPYLPPFILSSLPLPPSIFVSLSLFSFSLPSCTSGKCLSISQTLRPLQNFVTVKLKWQKWYVLILHMLLILPCPISGDINFDDVIWC